MSPDPKSELRVIARTEPPESRLNDSIVVLSGAGAALLGVLFAVTLLLDGPMAVYGLALAGGLLLLAVAIRRYFTDRFPDIEAVEPREVPTPDDAGKPLSDVEPLGPRRSFLKRVLLAASGVFGLSLLAPVASLGPSPQGVLQRTAWTSGLRLVRSDDTPLRPGDVAEGGVATVWPEGSVGEERSSVLLLRLSAPAEPPTRMEWIVADSLVAYSKVCTHAGCPVALYRQQDNALFCPCHQSTFNPAAGAVPTFGPAARALPQLPLGIDEQGYLVALGDFQEPVGPALPRS